MTNKKALVVVFDHSKKTQTGIAKNIPLSIELDIDATRDEHIIPVVKKIYKAVNCIVLTTSAKTQADKVNLMNQIRKYARINKIYLREIKLTD